MAAEIEAQIPTPIYGDILDVILSRLAFIHLVPASMVSKSWCRSVYSSLRRSKKRKPWLIIHVQSTRSPYTTSTYAYDAMSNIWMMFNLPSVEYVSALGSTQQNLMYMLSTSKFSFSFDPLHLTWHHVAAPTVSRIDPIVVLVDHRIVVAGSGYDFEDDPLSVEIYDLVTCTWTTCKSMPDSLKSCASSMWLSVAVNDDKLFLTEKHSNCGMTHTFDLATFTWSGPFVLLPDPIICNSITGFVDGHLMLIGLTNIEGGNVVTVWEVNCHTFECKIVGEMPDTLLVNLKGEDYQISSIEVCLVGSFAYIYKPTRPHHIITCEFVEGGCRWGSVSNAVVNDQSSMDRFVFTCAEVEIEELQKAMRLGCRPKVYREDLSCQID